MGVLDSSRTTFVAGRKSSGKVEVPLNWRNLCVRNSKDSSSNVRIIFYKDEAKTVANATVYQLEPGEPKDLNTGDSFSWPIDIETDGNTIDYIYSEG